MLAPRSVLRDFHKRVSLSELSKEAACVGERPKAPRNHPAPTIH